MFFNFPPCYKHFEVTYSLQFYPKIIQQNLLKKKKKKTLLFPYYRFFIGVPLSYFKIHPNELKLSFFPIPSYIHSNLVIYQGK